MVGPERNGENRDLCAGELLMLLPFGEDDIPPQLLAGVSGECEGGCGVKGGCITPPPTKCDRPLRGEDAGSGMPNELGGGDNN